MNKYEELIATIKEEYDENCELTADLVETLVYKQIIDEEVINAIIAGVADDDTIPELIGIASTYEDFMFGFNSDIEENNELKSSDEY
jgi:predicted nuclease with TOPRIM domain